MINDKDYSDIINLPHYVSPRHPQMSIEGRAAQFMGFAALRGFDDQVDDTSKRSELENENFGVWYEEIDEI